MLIRYFLFLILCLSSCERSQKPEREKMAYRIIRELQSRAYTKYHLKPQMEGGGFRHKISLFDLSFVHIGELSIEEMRSLLINLSIEFLEVINSNKEAQQYLVEYPFESERLVISVILYGEDGKRINNLGDSTDFIAMGVLKKNILYYSIVNEEKIYFQTIYDETYEHDIDIVNKENNG